MFVTKKELQAQLDTANNANEVLQGRNNFLNRKLENLQKDYDSISSEARTLRIQNMRYQTEAVQSTSLASQRLSTIADLRSEVGALRQIIIDLTGKNPDDMIEAHRKAVRLLAYEEVEPQKNETRGE